MTAADTVFLLSAVRLIGAAFGAVGITMGELFYARAVADGKLDQCEKDYIRATFWSLQWGMTLVLLSSFALIAVQYFAWEVPQDVLTAPFWLILTLAVIVIFVGWGRSRGRLPWWFGSSAGLTAWWGIFLLSSWEGVTLSYHVLLLGYVFMTFIVAAVFAVAREHLKMRKA